MKKRSEFEALIAYGCFRCPTSRSYQCLQVVNIEVSLAWKIKQRAFDRSIDTCNDVTELGHVVDLSPAMLANPAISTRIVRINGWRQNVEIVVMRGSNPIVFILVKENTLFALAVVVIHPMQIVPYLSIHHILFPVVAGHNASIAIRPSQHVGNSHLHFC